MVIIRGIRRGIRDRLTPVRAGQEFNSSSVVSLESKGVVGLPLHPPLLVSAQQRDLHISASTLLARTNIKL